jgi:hypothetical protein
MRKLILSAAFVLTVAAVSVAQFGGYGYGGIKYVTNVSDQTLNDENALILIKYVGTEEQATIDIATNSFELHVGDQGSAAAATNEAAGDVNVGNVCGAVASALDTSDAECDTFGELVRVINANSADHGFVAVLVGALPADAIAGPTDFIDPADADVKIEGGYAILPDSSVHDEIPGLFAPWLNQTIRRTVQGKFSIEPFLSRGTSGGQSQVLKGNPIPESYIPFLQYWIANSNDTGVPNFQVYSLTYDNEDGTPTARLILPLVMADDTDLQSSANYLFAPLQGDPGSLLLIRVVAAAAQTDTDDQLDFFGFYGELDTR